MRQINEQRRKRVQLLSDRLVEIENEKNNLLVQLEDLAAKAAAVRSEHNTLHNLDAPTSELPDEVLASIFEMGTRSNWESPRDFQVLVSHVSHRWRAIALATAQLWASIRYIVTAGDIPSRSTAKVLAYISRSQLSPLDVLIQRKDSQNTDPALVQSIMHHIGRCRRLRIQDAPDALQEFFKTTIHQPASSLVQLELKSQHLPLLPAPIIPLGAPHLRIVGLNWFPMTPAYIACCLPAFELITHLRLAKLPFASEDSYRCFQALLTSLKCLSHLELQPIHCSVPAPRPALVLPSLLFLHIDFSRLGGSPSLGNFVGNLHATSLETLSLAGWVPWPYPPPELISAHSHYPSLQRLILSAWNPMALALFARRFPDIEHLTCPVECFDRLGPEQNQKSGFATLTEGTVLWPNLQSIAVPASRKRLDTSALLSNIRELQGCRPRLRKLLLPISETQSMRIERQREVALQHPFGGPILPKRLADTDDVRTLQEIINVEDLHLIAKHEW